MKHLPLGRPHGLRRNAPAKGRSVHFRVAKDGVECDGDQLVFREGQPARGIFLGSDGQTDYYATMVDDELTDIRQVAPLLNAREAGLAVQAVALFQWNSAVRFCERCGAKLDPWQGIAGSGSDSSWERVCARGHAVYPRTDPAVIMAIVDDDDRLLLGRNTRWPAKRFSTLAGFVEAGETLEAAVGREVYEEVGIVVCDVEYRGSQPWPFPRSLMLAFRGRASAVGPQLVRPDGEEIAEAKFFSREELATRVRDGELILPGQSSVAYALIEEWFGQPLSELTRN